MKSEYELPESIAESPLVSEGRRHIPRAIVALGAVLALLSCSDPLSEAPVPGGSGNTGRVVELSARLTGVRRDSTGRVGFQLTVTALDSAARPVPNAELSFSTLVGSDSVSGPDVFGPDGYAALAWVTRDTLAPLHLLEIRSGDRALLRITRGTADPAGGPVPVDTVLGLVPGGVAIRVVDAFGRPVSEQLVSLHVPSGEGSLDHETLVTDRFGAATTQWRLGSKAGLQSVQVSVLNRNDYRIVDSRSGASAPPGKALQLVAIALPGVPQKLNFGTDTLQVDAIGARVRVAALGHDSHGNVIAQPPLSLESPDTSIARKQPDGSLRSTGAGVGRVYVTAGAAKDSLRLLVIQRVVAVRVVPATSTLTHLGASTVMRAEALDRLGAPVVGAVFGLRSLTPDIAEIAGPDTLRALRPGSALIEASTLGLADTSAIQIVQVPAAIVLPPLADTLALDQSQALPVQVFDSGGALIANPPIQVTVSDSSVIAVDSTGTLTARLPGRATVIYSAAPVTASVERVVEGVAILWGGQRISAPGVLPCCPDFMITNGRVRIRLSAHEMSLPGAVRMDVRLGDSWQPATGPYGDWLYVTSAVSTPPTEISIVQLTPDRIGLRLRYGSHWFLPQEGGYPDTFVAQPYPFDRTLWLSQGENGYYSWVDLYSDTGSLLVEHETGFGGLFGPATLRTSQVHIRTDTLSQTVVFNGDARSNTPGSLVDAVQFSLDGDPVRRVLVPVPEAPFITPVFPGWGYGSVWRYSGAAHSFGVYMYADSAGSQVPVSAICRGAWTNAPFPLHQVSEAEFGGCGPTAP